MFNQKPKEARTSILSASPLPDEEVDAILDEFLQSHDEIKEVLYPSTKCQPKETSAADSEIVHTINLKRNHKIIFKNEEIEPIEYLLSLIHI